MSGGYRFAKTKQGGIMKATPDKDYGADFNGIKVAFSHVCDDLQYAALVVHGGMLPYIRTHLAPRPRATGPRVSSAGWT
jgi:hypothetical protein